LFHDNLLWRGDLGSFKRLVDSLEIEDYEDNRHTENEEQAQEDNQCGIHGLHLPVSTVVLTTVRLLTDYRFMKQQ